MFQTAKILLAIALAAGAVAAQRNGAPSSPATREMRHRLNLIATRATANFQSADSIERGLGSLGVALHPQLVALRLRIQGSLDAAEAAIRQGDLQEATEELDRAEGFLNRFARRIGGD